MISLGKSDQKHNLWRNHHHHHHYKSQVLVSGSSVSLFGPFTTRISESVAAFACGALVGGVLEVHTCSTPPTGPTSSGLRLVLRQLLGCRREKCTGKWGNEQVSISKDLLANQILWSNKADKEAEPNLNLISQPINKYVFIAGVYFNGCKTEKLAVINEFCDWLIRLNLSSALCWPSSLY